MTLDLNPAYLGLKTKQNKGNDQYICDLSPLVDRELLEQTAFVSFVSADSSILPAGGAQAASIC